MLTRRLWTQAPRTRSWSTAANLRLGLQKHGKQQRLSRAYSNYAPKGPPPYYNMYGQSPKSPKSRTSRLKDMAIGSILTITAYIAHCYWAVLEETKEDEEYFSELHGIFSHYNQLLGEAEASGDDSPESMEKIQSLFKERAMVLTRAGIQKDEENRSVRELGPLPKLPEDHKCKCHGVQSITDSDTLILMPPQPPADKLKEMNEFAWEHGLLTRTRIVTHDVVVAVNAFAGDMKVGGSTWQGLTNSSPSKLHEIICRSLFMIDKLLKEGIFNGDGPTMVTVILRDTIFSFVYNGVDIGIIGGSNLGRMSDYFGGI
ncbi:hypothetical protein E0Z10_g8544 [Xylaria hypoxylon]|uniref:Uncharacterized protein n=1 Tax=Xylaria hypoxylon TaxID=37992 RepID=A0A4Z0YMN2_9PEZI|nr:hypothetical protein E0Z10_g8544 [Xylaria hypoxylon]